jgi:uncharacterized membrane protein (UPF0127 family)
MKNLFAVCAALLASTGCMAVSPPSQPLPVTGLTIDSDHGPAKFMVEVAADPQSQEYGLMNRKALAPNAGMLFDFHKPQCEAFWMKDTILSLDIIFIRDDGSISSIAANAVPFSTTTIISVEPVRAVLELNGGRAAALDINPGDKVHGTIFTAVHTKNAPSLVCR